MKFNDLQWFEPLWKRAAVVAVCVLWCIFEFWRGDQTWGWIMVAMSGYAIWTFFITFEKNLQKGKNDAEPPPPAS